LLASVIAIAVAMGLGTLVSAGFERLGLVLPAYVGAMIAASVLRNLDDRFRFLGISQHHVDAVGSVALYVFIVMALMALRLWEIAALAAPLLVMLSMQVVLAAGMCLLMTFRAMGRDYEAAVMTSGFCGFMLGTTANALACMDVLARKYGPAPRAFIIVPLVGAFLIDFANALIITVMANLLR
jgi:ESS family glutamate:Na+ symporter